MNANQEFNAQRSLLLGARKKLDDQYVIPNSSLAAGGFNIWWQKTFAQHTAMAAEASALMRTHSRVSSANQARDGQAR